MLTQKQINEYGQRAKGISQSDWENLIKEIADLDHDVFSNLAAILHRRDELAGTSIPARDECVFACTPEDMGFHQEQSGDTTLGIEMLCNECGLDIRFGHKTWCTSC